MLFGPNDPPSRPCLPVFIEGDPYLHDPKVVEALEKYEDEEWTP